jgi:hypothetical protein
VARGVTFESVKGNTYSREPPLANAFDELAQQMKDVSRLALVGPRIRFQFPLAMEVITGYLVERLLCRGQGLAVWLEAEETLVVFRTKFVIPGQQVNHQDQFGSELFRMVLSLSNGLKQSKIFRIVGEFLSIIGSLARHDSWRRWKDPKLIISKSNRCSALKIWMIGNDYDRHDFLIKMRLKSLEIAEAKSVFNWQYQFFNKFF